MQHAGWGVPSTRAGRAQSGLAILTPICESRGNKIDIR